MWHTMHMGQPEREALGVTYRQDAFEGVWLGSEVRVTTPRVRFPSSVLLPSTLFSARPITELGCAMDGYK